MTFTQSTLDLISHIVVGIYKDSRCQSERGIPDLSPFKNDLIFVKLLKAKERFPRIYCVFLDLSNLYVVKHLCTKKQEMLVNEVDT